MTPTPPYFLAQMQEQKKWDDGFKAGAQEIIVALEESTSSEDMEGPTKEWVKDFSAKVTKKYL
jgi:hypothetical protein